MSNIKTTKTLTPREEEVALHLSEGMTYKEISIHLGIGLGTVKKHISSVIHKLGARNSAHIVKILFEQGYMPIEAENE